MSLETISETSVSFRIKYPLNLFKFNQKNFYALLRYGKTFQHQISKTYFQLLFSSYMGRKRQIRRIQKAKNAEKFIPGELHHTCIAHSTNANLCEIHKNFFFHCFLNKSLWDRKTVNYSRNIKNSCFQIFEYFTENT